MSQRVISFHYTLTDTKGQTLDSSSGREPLSFVEGKGQIIPGLETELGKLPTGTKQRVLVPAAQAYGVRNTDLVFEVPLDRMPTSQIKVGDQFRSPQSPMPLTVMKVTDTHATLDANHPLAGEDLTFDVEVTGVRAATEEDLKPQHECCGSHDQGCCGSHAEEEHSHGGGCCSSEAEEESHGHSHGGGCCGH